MNQIENIKNVVKNSPHFKSSNYLEDWTELLTIFENKELNNKKSTFIEISKNTKDYKLLGRFVFPLWVSSIGGNYNIITDKENIPLKELNQYKNYIKYSQYEKLYNIFLEWNEKESLDVVLININDEEELLSVLNTILPIVHENSLLIVHDCLSSYKTINKMKGYMVGRGYNYKNQHNYIIFFQGNTLNA